MNDFSKEELKELLRAYQSDFYTSGSSADLDLMNKIQSMIENYCEHELCYIDYDHQPFRCRNCKEIVE